MPRSRMLSRKLAIAASSAIMVVVAACGGDGESALPTATQANAGGIPAKLTTVTVSDNKFAPLNLQIPAGANVTWNWTGSNPHQVVGSFNGQEVSSPKLTGTGVFLFHFASSGVFEYHCGVHGDAMNGTITVQ